MIYDVFNIFFYGKRLGGSKIPTGGTKEHIILVDICVFFLNYLVVGFTKRRGLA